MVSRQVVTMANCIVGVSVLAMPFCFKQCGVVLASTLLMLSGIMTRTVCYFLLKASTITRRRTYELLAYHTFGQAGKLVVEISIIGFLIGTLIAFLVVMGDLGPQIVADVFDVENNMSLRSIIMTALSLFVALPLGLLRNIDSLSSVSTVTMLFYVILVAKIFSEGMGPLWSGSFLTRIHYWRPAGVLQCIPIFSMALSCQTQIFSIYDSLPEPSLQKMNEVIRKAVNVCTVFYICVGFLGYIAFCTQNFGGNILLSFGPTWSTQMIKICFVLSIAFSFPLVIFPCRASLHSLFFKRVHLHHHVHEITTNYIPESRLKLLTVGIIGFTLFVGLMIPNVELVLGLVGSTTGSVICIIFPAVMFIRVTSKNTTERILAQGIFIIGVVIMVVTTYATLYAVEQAQVNEPVVIMDQPHVTELNAGVKFVPKEPAELKKISQDVEKLIPKVAEELPKAAKNPEPLIHAEVKEPEYPEARKKPVDEIPKDDNIVKVPKPPEVSPHGVESVKNEEPPPDKPSRDEPKDLKAKKPVEAPEVRPEVAQNANPVEREHIEAPAPPPQAQIENRVPQDKVNPNLNQVPAIEMNPQLKMPLPSASNMTLSKKSSGNQTISKTSPLKLNAEDFLLQQLKEHEKEQKKLLEEQKEILAKLKQHQADDELKNQARGEVSDARKKRPPEDTQVREVENEVVKPVNNDAVQSNNEVGPRGGEILHAEVRMASGHQKQRNDQVNLGNDPVVQAKDEQVPAKQVKPNIENPKSDIEGRAHIPSDVAGSPAVGIDSPKGADAAFGGIKESLNDVNSEKTKNIAAGPVQLPAAIQVEKVPLPGNAVNVPEVKSQNRDRDI